MFPTIEHLNVAVFSVLVLKEAGLRASKFKPVSSHITGPVLSPAYENTSYIRNALAFVQCNDNPVMVQILQKLTD